MVHVNVGGWMGNVPAAAGDPIFYVHHCQVDRLYASWEAESGVSYNWGTSATQPSEKDWTTEKAFFADEKGNLVEIELGGAVSTAKLGYIYDNLAKPPAGPLLSQLPAAATAARPFAKLAAMRTGNVRIGAGGTTMTLDQGAAALTAAPTPGAAAGGAETLVLSGIKLLRRPPAPLQVFVNLPAGTAPQLNSPYYVGVLNLFNFDLGTGAPMAHGADHTPAGGGEAKFDVGAILSAQRAKGLWDGNGITVTVTTLGADNAAAVTYLTIGSVALLP